MSLRVELEKYIYQSNESLLNIFKNDLKGEEYFNDFIKLLKEELKSHELFNDVSLSKFKNGIEGENSFIRFMSLIRSVFVPEEVTAMSKEHFNRIQEEIKGILE